MWVKPPQWLLDYLLNKVATREPDLFIGGKERPYMLRWYVTPWRRTNWGRRLPAIYLHMILRSDDDRALHCHPWENLSWLLEGQYIEHRIAAGGIHERQLMEAGDLKVRLATTAHRLELVKTTARVTGDPELGNYTETKERPCWSLFFTGFRRRIWGFHCAEQGRWVPYDEFASYVDGVTEISRGCE